LAVVAEGEAARRLALRVLTCPDGTMARLSGVAGRGLLVLLGAEADLPWVDGVRYLGRDPEAPALLLPTALALTAPLLLVERALLGAAKDAAPPYAVLLEPLRLVPLGGARSLERARLGAWLKSSA
jgi:hypothetical protein